MKTLGFLDNILYRIPIYAELVPVKRSGFLNLIVLTPFKLVDF